EHARRHAESLGVEVARVVRVPGVYDMAPVVKRLLRKRDIDGVVMIGAVIKHDTKHDEVIATAIAQAGLALASEFENRVGLSITGPGMTDAQAVARIETASRGVDSVIKVVQALKEIG